MSPLFLAIDTATAHGTVACGTGEGSPVERTIASESRAHARNLRRCVRDLLTGQGASARDVTDVVVADGPGSFTGLRIGAAFAKGFAYDGDVRVHAVPSMLGAAAFASDRGLDETLGVLYDAQRGEVFAALFRVGNMVLPPRLVEAARLDTLGEAGGAGGEGALRYADEVSRWTGRPPLSHEALRPSAAALLDRVTRGGDAWQVAELDSWEPVYGREAAAQTKWEARHGRPMPGT